MPPRLIRQLGDGDGDGSSGAGVVGAAVGTGAGVGVSVGTGDDDGHGDGDGERLCLRCPDGDDLGRDLADGTGALRRRLACRYVAPGDGSAVAAGDGDCGALRTSGVFTTAMVSAAVIAGSVVAAVSLLISCAPPTPSIATLTARI